MKNAIRDMKNLGPASEAMLHAADICDANELIKLGAVSAFIKVKQCGQNPSLNLLYAIHGAITDVHWNRLGKDVRNQLLLELDAQRDALQLIEKLP